ncbi:MAG: hypothetical protein FWE40_02340 [Oscillospiraceae bacterium]|nr:hypothetical protein [Oscillospiraceae bacterium]
MEQPNEHYAEGVVEEKAQGATQDAAQRANAQGQKVAKQVYAKTKKKTQQRGKTKLDKPVSAVENGKVKLKQKPKHVRQAESGTCD